MQARASTPPVSLELFGGVKRASTKPQSAVGGTCAVRWYGSSARGTPARPLHDISRAVVANLDRRRDFVSVPPRNCDAGGRFAIFAVAQVDVRDESGDVVAQGRLAVGERIPQGAACSMPFRLSDVPHSAPYDFWVGGRPLGAFSHAEMVDMNWTVVFQLGEPRGR